MLASEGYGYLPIPEVDQIALESFTCGKPHLDGFLAGSALELHTHRLGFTSVVFHQDFDGPVGYFTLQNDGVPLEASEKMELGYADYISLPAFPAVKIGRLAVHEMLQGQGVGSHIIALIIGEILDLSTFSAARLLVVDADNDECVLNFYRGLGFERSLWAQNQLQKHAKKNVRPPTIKLLRDVLYGL